MERHFQTEETLNIDLKPHIQILEIGPSTLNVRTHHTHKPGTSLTTPSATQTPKQYLHILNTRICIQIHVYIYIYTYTRIYIYVYIYTCIYVYMCSPIHIPPNPYEALPMRALGPAIAALMAMSAEASAACQTLARVKGLGFRVHRVWGLWGFGFWVYRV